VAVAVIFASVVLAGCDARYLAHAAYEEGRLLWHREPINEILENPDLPKEERAKLKTVLAVREFDADQLGLRVGGAYKTITQVDKNAIVWVLMAAPRDSLTPYTWWFPIVGNVPYRGYFNKDSAEAEAAKLEASGYDTYVRPAVAFSSLGFFNDPLLSNLLALNRIDLAGVITHELFHRTYFLASDVMFDESAATWVGSRGAAAFYASTEGAESADALAARSLYESDLKFADFLLREQGRLLRFYDSEIGHEAILRRRPEVFAEINADYAHLKPFLSGLDRFDLDKIKLNNAIMLNFLIYFHDLQNFAALDRINHGDVRTTIQEIIRLAKSEPGDPFHAVWLASLSAPSPQPALPLTSK
jgi:predicted aminopeptidase